MSEVLEKENNQDVLKSGVESDKQVATDEVVTKQSEVKTYTQEELDTITETVRANAYKKALEEQKVEIDKQNLTSEERIAELEKMMQEKEVAAKNERTTLAFDNKMISAGVDEVVRKQLLASVAVDKMSEFDVTPFAKKEVKAGLPADDEPVKTEKTNVLDEAKKKMKKY